MSELCMTLKEYRSRIMNKYKEGQEISIKANFDESCIRKVRVKIVKFYPFHVHVLQGGINRCYTYWEFYRKLQDPKKNEVIVPARLKRGSYKR